MTNNPIKHPYFKITKRMVKLDKEAWHLKILEAKKIQAITRGKGGKVAIIDSGVDGEHPEIFGKLTIKMDRTGEGYQPGDHGTFVAGEMAGENVGLFPELELGDFKALTAVEGFGEPQWVSWAIRDAQREGFEVISASLGSDYSDSIMKKAIEDYCQSTKNFFVAASGNDGKGTNTERSTDYPGNYAGEIPGVISVGACGIKKDGNVYIPTWSSRGNVTIVAPGVDIVGILPNGEYGIMSGTSMATPLVAAIIAACKTLQPNLEQSDIPYLFSSSKNIEDGNKTDGNGLISVIDILTKAKALKKDKVAQKPVSYKSRKTFLEWIKSIFGL